MKTINFITTNKGKVTTLQHAIDADRFTIMQMPLNLIEPQANTVAEVALSKAKQAFEQLKKPLIVEDSAFHINALNGFPGPYSKYILETISAEQFMRMLLTLEDNTCYFTGTIVYMDEQGEPHIFHDERITGIIADILDATENPEAWSYFWRVFIPDGHTKTLSALGDEELRGIRTKWASQSAYHNFANWIAAQ